MDGGFLASKIPVAVSHIQRTVQRVHGHEYEYMECKSCKGASVDWVPRMLEQLSAGIRAYFPSILMRKYACDQNVVEMLRARTQAIVQLLCATIC